MTDPSATSPQHSADDGSPRSIIRADGWALVIGAAATVAVELGAFFLARAGGAGLTASMLVSLAVSAVWVALASPAFGAGGQGIMSCWLRGGAVADASAIALFVLWLVVPAMTFVSAVKIYCIYAAVALAAAAVVGVGKSSAGRAGLAVAVAVALMIALASPVWLGGPVSYLEGEAAQALTSAAVKANPFFAVMAAVSENVRQPWTEMTLMYELTALGDTVPLPPVRWHAPVPIYLAVVAAGLGASLVRRRRLR